MEKELTLQDLIDMPPSTVFATGLCKNSPEDIYMTDENIGKEMRWVAKRGKIHDWAIYIDWSFRTQEQVEDFGNKIYDSKNIRKLVNCTDEALQMYRK